MFIPVNGIEQIKSLQESKTLKSTLLSNNLPSNFEALRPPLLPLIHRVAYYTVKLS